MEYIPDRGHIIWITFDPQAGHEQTGRRPAFVLSPIGYNGKTGLAVMCPITSVVKGYPFEVNLPDSFPIKGVILSDHLKNLDWKAREAQYSYSCGQEIIKEVLGKVHALLF